MALPEVDIQPGDSIQAADRKVDAGLRGAGLELTALDGLNSHLATAPYCRFHQGQLDGRELVVCVMVRPWDDASVLAVLNILLNIRMDPEPPGPPPVFRFYSAHPVPPVLLGLFGDSPGSDFECRAALVANFGSELAPAQAPQLAAVAIHLLRECFRQQIDLCRPDGELELGRSIVEGFGAGRFPASASPLNALIVLGFLFGEMLGARIPHPRRWQRVKELAPWPALVFGAAGADRGGVPHVVVSPIASVLKTHELQAAGYLREVAQALQAKCRAVFGGEESHPRS